MFQPAEEHMSMENKNHSCTRMEAKAREKSSQDLLSCGVGGGGLHDKLLLKPKPDKSFQTEKIAKSSVLERLQNFLPQMAEANKKLKQEMEESSPECFNIEGVQDCERVIEMDVAVVELSDADSNAEEDETSDSEQDTDSDEASEVTEQNLKLPGNKNKKKVDIQVLEQ